MLIQKFWVVSGLLSPILRLIDFSLFYYLYRKLVLKYGNSRDFMQYQINEYYEPPVYPIKAHEAELTTLMKFSFIFIPYFPIGIAISIIGCFFTFWVDKV